MRRIVASSSYLSTHGSHQVSHALLPYSPAFRSMCYYIIDVTMNKEHAPIKESKIDKNSQKRQVLVMTLNYNYRYYLFLNYYCVPSVSIVPSVPNVPTYLGHPLLDPPFLLVVSLRGYSKHGTTLTNFPAPSTSDCSR